MRFLETLRRFLYGRYAMQGTDRLNRLLAILAVILSVINLILHSLAIYIIQTFLIFWFVFRMLSRNIPARTSENEALLRLEKRFFSSKVILKRRFNERKTHIYKTCPNCKAKLRFRRIKGTHNAHCPKCNKNFSVRVR